MTLEPVARPSINWSVSLTELERLLLITLLEKAAIEIRSDPEMQHNVDECRTIINKLQNSPYVHDGFPKRACDFCGKIYSGPAVYCSLHCALADA